MGEEDVRRFADRHMRKRETGQSWIRYFMALAVIALVMGMVLVPDLVLRNRGEASAAGPTPVTLSPPAMPTASYLIGGIGASPATVPPLPTATPVAPTDLPVPTATPTVAPTLAPTATALPPPPTTTPSGPTPTPDQGAQGAAAPVNGAIMVPVLMYHYIRVNPDPRDQIGFGLSVTPDDFAAQMQWLVTQGYHTVLPTDVRHALADGTPLPTKPIVLTFDDGYRDFYTAAWPILQQYGLKAASAVITAYADKGDAGDELYMNWDMIRTLDSTGMVEIASHTVFHADLTRATGAQRMTELSQSKTTIEDQLAHPCTTFVYPSGMFNAAVVADTARVGYQLAFTTESGKVRAPADNGHMLTLPRIRVNGGESLTAFAQDLGG